MKLRCENICKSYGEEVILDMVNFGVEAGEAAAITGSSGKGKSTLISIMGLLTEPDSGGIYLDELDILNADDKTKAGIRNRKFGFVFQHTQLVGSITVLDNVIIPGLFAKVKGIEAKAMELLDELGLGDRKYHYPYQLSIGQKRRAALARALVLEPDVIFADEPTNDLDVANADVVSKTLFKCVDVGKTLILVTHDRKLACKAGIELKL